jgi:DNA-directed RNA polymerase
MSAVWPAIGDVIVKGRQAMTWLKRAGRAIAKDLPKEDGVSICWQVPSGFVAVQAYPAYEVTRVVSKLFGATSLKVASAVPGADVSKHAAGMAPNFVHSLDAAHLHLTTAACRAKGVKDFAMVHDDFGVHAAHTQVLYDTLREEFRKMYTDFDPVADFHKRYPIAGDPPAKGTLDVSLVTKSEFFFS